MCIKYNTINTIITAYINVHGINIQYAPIGNYYKVYY